MIFQKAYTGNNKGKNKEAYMIYNQLINDNKINEKYRELILSNIESASLKFKKTISLKLPTNCWILILLLTLKADSSNF